MLCTKENIGQENIDLILRIKQGLFKNLAGAEENKDKKAIRYFKNQIKDFDEATEQFLN